jgi:hypothetical protein
MRISPERLFGALVWKAIFVAINGELIDHVVGIVDEP